MTLLTPTIIVKVVKHVGDQPIAVLLHSRACRELIRTPNSIFFSMKVIFEDKMRTLR